MHRCSVVVVFISRTQNSPHPPKNYMEGVQVRTQEWLPGHQAHHRAESRLRNTGRAGGGASFLLSQIKIAQRASPRLWGFVKGTMDTCAHLHCLGIQPEPCFPVFSNAKENTARAFHRREALMRMVIRPASAAEDASHSEARRFVVQ